MRLAFIVCALSLTSVFSQISYAQTTKKNDATRGKQLFNSLNCSMCHAVDDAGGCMGPPLNGATKVRSEAYLKLRLTKNKEAEFVKTIKHPELFPHPRFSSAEVTSLIAYLKTLDKKTGTIVNHKITRAVPAEKPALPFVPAKSTASSREGRRLLLDTGCMSCHSINNTGGSIGPALDGIGARRSRAYIEAHITDPQAHLKTGKSKMVQPDLWNDQIKNIADFLLTLPPQPSAKGK